MFALSVLRRCSARPKNSGLRAVPMLTCAAGVHGGDRPGGSTARAKRVSIEGNIAVGKSTFARLLQSVSSDWEVMVEPVSQWQNIPSSSSESTVSNLLQMMYQEPRRWSYTFQTFSCMSRLKTQLQPPPPQLPRLHGTPVKGTPVKGTPVKGTPVKGTPVQGTPVQVYERSVYSDRYVFALNMFELGCINATEWAVYQDWHSFLVEEFGPRVELEGIIYLRAPPQKCLERLERRGRSEEKEVKLEYLEKLHRQHERWLHDRTTEVHFDKLKEVPVLQLDASEEFQRDPAVRAELISKVKSFFDSLI